MTAAPATAGFEARIADTVFLIVDDVASMRAIAVSQLRRLGATKLIEAADGADALRIMASQPVGMVLSDWRMPGMSGLELLEAMRRDAALKAVPFVMVTGEVEREYVQRAIAAGVAAILVKPYSGSRLAERIQRALRWKARGGAAAMPAARAAAAPRRSTVLVVDDTPDNLHLMSELLKDDYRVKVAPSGERALDICQGDDPPDLVLLDVMMPGLDGFEVLERLRGHPGSEFIPVIFITALSDQASRMKGLDLGAVDVVAKPIDPDTLKARIRNFMRYVELHRQLQGEYDDMLEAARLRDEMLDLAKLHEPLAAVAAIARNLASEPGRGADDLAKLRVIQDTALGMLETLARYT